MIQFKLRMWTEATSSRMAKIVFQTIHDVTLMIGRERTGREVSPSVRVVDSQSVKATVAVEHGYGAGKKINGRKRHIAVDTIAVDVVP